MYIYTCPSSTVKCWYHLLKKRKKASYWESVYDQFSFKKVKMSYGVLFSVPSSLSLPSDALSSWMLAIVNPPWDGCLSLSSSVIPSAQLSQFWLVLWFWTLQSARAISWCAWLALQLGSGTLWCGTDAGPLWMSPSPASCMVQSERPTQSLFQYRMFWLGTSSLCLK